jgi:hypothetical protein
VTASVSRAGTRSSRGEAAAVGERDAGDVDAASFSAWITAWAEPSKLAGRWRAIATWRASASASMLSDMDSACSTSRAIGAECTVPRVFAPAGASPRTTVAPGAPRASASADPASMPGLAAAGVEPGLTRAPSTAVAVTGAA